MKFQTTSYHFDLLRDSSRLAVFYEAIMQCCKNNNVRTAFDIGCGSGILTFFLQPYLKNIIAVENDEKTYKTAEDNLKEFSNVDLVNEDAISYKFPINADLIVCEMLDTALIDEEQVPAINNAKKYLNENGIIIPEGIVNMAQLVNMEREYFHYDDVDANVGYETLSDEIVYSRFNFLDDFSSSFRAEIRFKANRNSTVNGIKITTVTKVFNDIVCGPTPMLNPPLLVPLDEKEVKKDETISIELSYVMGEGIETIKTSYI